MYESIERSIIRLTIEENSLLDLSNFDTKARAPVIYYYRFIVSDNAKLESVFAHLAKYHYIIDEAYHIPFEETTHFIFTSTCVSRIVRLSQTRSTVRKFSTTYPILHK